MNLQNKDQIRSIYACIHILNDLEHLLSIAMTTGMSVREWEKIISTTKNDIEYRKLRLAILKTKFI